MTHLTVGHAYVPRQTARAVGANHAVLTTEFTAGRLRRKAGDALCKPASQFWGLERHRSFEEQGVNCQRCREIAKRLNLTLPGSF